MLLKIVYHPPRMFWVKSATLICVVCWVGVSFAQEIDVEDQQVETLVLASSPEALPSPSELSQFKAGLLVAELDIPGGVETLNAFLQPVYLGKSLDEKTLKETKKKIYEYYQDQERPFVYVSTPPQSAQSGTMQFVIEESRLGQLHVTGNKWANTKRIEQYFRIYPGDPISQRRIQKDTNFANRNPFRRVNVIYQAGTKYQTTDITVEVDARKPYRFYVGTDNTGVPTTGRQRVFAGFAWDQLFNLDHVFFYQYSTNYSAHKFHANTFQYMALLPWEAILNLYGGYATVHANLPAPSRTNRGQNLQASMRYYIPFLPFHSFTHEFLLGFDWKNTNNTLEFTDFNPVFGQEVNLTQWILGYHFGWERPAVVAIEGGAEIFASPFEWLSHQTDFDFSSLRTQAKNHWIYGVGFFRYKQHLPRSWVYTMFARAQWSSEVILPSEQLGLGGYDTIRGYDQRQFNVDNGFFVSNELHTPPFSVVRSREPNRDRMYFLLFLDGGYGVDKVAVANGIPKGDYLIGVGPGARYSFGPYLTARFDLGFKLHHQDIFTGGAAMIHFGATGSY